MSASIVSTTLPVMFDEAIACPVSRVNPGPAQSGMGTGRDGDGDETPATCGYQLILGYATIKPVSVARRTGTTLPSH